MYQTHLHDIDLSALQYLRHKLHSQPDLSGNESATARIIESFLQETQPDRIIHNLGGNGLALIYDSGRPGPTIGFRCELDALPIQENNTWPHRSNRDCISHKCGHDGHMTIVSGIGLWLNANPLPYGKVILLFQPAEETGEGAYSVIKDPRWQEIKPDWLFGLHNIPGYPAGSVLWKDGPFCAASKGMMLRLNGVTSHAAEPEKGVNPAQSLARIMLDMQALPANATLWQQLVLVTPVYAHLGDKAFGTSAGYAEFGATLRAFDPEDMKLLTYKVEEIIRYYCTNQGLNFNINYLEEFPATVNPAVAGPYVRTAAINSGLSIKELSEPFRWSEDFGWYRETCQTAFVGLGAGENQPGLHHPDYDFPDEIIAPGLQMFVSLIRQILL